MAFVQARFWTPPRITGQNTGRNAHVVRCRVAEGSRPKLTELFASTVRQGTVAEVAVRSTGAKELFESLKLYDGSDSDPSPEGGPHEALLFAIGEHTSESIRSLFNLLQGHNIRVRNIRRLCSDKHVRALELSLNVSSGEFDSVQRVFRGYTDETGVDTVLRKSDDVSRSLRLAIFDLDSTLIQLETADTIAKHIGKMEECSAVTRDAMNGKMEFGESLRRRVSLFEGLDESVLDEVKRDVPYTAGVKRLMRVLKSMGCTTCICSGGFTFLTDHVRDTLGMDASFSNVLEVVDGKLTGRTTGPVVDSQRKADVLTVLRDFLQVHESEILAVGDGANDLPMLREAGLGVAFNAKPKVQTEVDYRLNQESMDSILYLLGLTDDEIAKLAA
mmetsp:Transcript_12258/g.37396  ORF Transcript_12258/g.37396 Transcript_12258/m.37396 type:complete len:388 (-) Transcript_12258:88-1251(-)